MFEKTEWIRPLWESREGRLDNSPFRSVGRSFCIRVNDGVRRGPSSLGNFQVERAGDTGSDPAATFRSVNLISELEVARSLVPNFR